MAYSNSVIDTLGNTPLIKLRKLSEELGCLVLVKNEASNPSLSIKDRVANYMLETAEQENRIEKGGTIIEATSGNAGISLALVAAAKGYKMVSVLSEKQSQEKKEILKALGSEVIVCPSDLHPDDSRSAYAVASRLHKRTPNSWFVSQHNNSSNSKAHYNNTGPEIWNQTEGKVTHFITTINTGGTISGVSKYLKEQNSNVKTWGVDAYGSLLKKFYDTGLVDQNESYPYETEGVGVHFIPENFDVSLIDGIQKITDRDAAVFTKNLAKEEGLLLGNSIGAVIKAAKNLKDQFTSEDVVVLIANDHGTRYLSKVYNDDWMQQKGFVEQPARTAIDLVKNPDMDVITVKTSELVSHAVGRMRKFKISQIPVIDKQGFVGSIDEMSLFSAYLDDHRKSDTPISEVMNKPFPMVQEFSPIEEVLDLIRKGNSAVLVALENEKHGIVTKSDVLTHIQ